MKKIIHIGILAALMAFPCCRQHAALSLQGVIEVEGRQGVASDGEYYYISGSTALYKYTPDGTLVLSNETPFEAIVAGNPASRDGFALNEKRFRRVVERRRAKPFFFGGAGGGR